MTSVRIKKRRRHREAQKTAPARRKRARAPGAPGPALGSVCPDVTLGPKVRPGVCSGARPASRLRGPHCTGLIPRRQGWVSIMKSLIQFTTCIEVGRKSGFSPQTLQKPLRELTPGTSTSGKTGWGHFSLLLPLGTAKTPEYKLSNIQGLLWWSSG